MNKLKFIGGGGAFSIKRVNNSAYYKYDDKIILFDCGETVFHQILVLNILVNVKHIDIIITHFHSDHVGSLGSLVFYCRYKNISVNIIFPNKDLSHNLLETFGIQKDLYNLKYPEEITAYYIKEYAQVHGDVLANGEIFPMPSYGYQVKIDDFSFFYSGDTSIIHDIIIKKFESHEIEFLYQEVTNDGYKAHVSLELLKQKIKSEDRNRVMCMHLNDSVDVNELKKIGFRSVE